MVLKSELVKKDIVRFLLDNDIIHLCPSFYLYLFDCCKLLWFSLQSHSINKRPMCKPRRTFLLNQSVCQRSTTWMSSILIWSCYCFCCQVEFPKNICILFSSTFSCPVLPCTFPSNVFPLPLLPNLVFIPFAFYLTN